jgi:hypothetical protein
MLPCDLFLLAAALITGSTARSHPVQYPINHNDIDPQRPLLSSGTPASSNNLSPFDVSHPSYICFKSFPPSNSWPTWEHLWEIHREQILSSNGGDTYIQHYIQEAILDASQLHNIDPRILLSIAMENSNGKASAPCTASQQGFMSVCGIMQVQDAASFDASRPKQSIEENVARLAEILSLHVQVQRDLLLGDLPEGLRAHGILNGKSEAGKRGMGRWDRDVANWLMGWDGRGKGFEECI